MSAPDDPPAGAGEELEPGGRRIHARVDDALADPLQEEGLAKALEGITGKELSDTLHGIGSAKLKALGSLPDDFAVAKLGAGLSALPDGVLKGLGLGAGPSAALVKEATRLAESAVTTPYFRPIQRGPDPTDVRLDELNDQIAQLVDYESRAAQRAELQAQLGVQQDHYTRRVAIAGLILAVVSAIVGVVGVVADVVIAAIRG